MSAVITFVILGATGDLSQHKLVPALFTIWCKSRSPKELRILGLALPRLTNAQFREHIWKGVTEFQDLAVRKKMWTAFAKRLHYVSGDLTKLEDLTKLRKKLEALESGNAKANRLYYLAISPHHFQAAIENMAAAGLAKEETGWRRVVIEKPFGTDLTSAISLNETVRRVFREEQVYRIDHYLGKETVQNLLAFRFANTIFEPLWNRNYVDNVQITVAEKISVRDRSGYYDRTGVVRDMIQNHLLQLVALVGLEPPNSMDAESLRSRKVDVLKAVRRITPGWAANESVRGQYRGYTAEKGVPKESKTATYAAVRLHVDNWRWHGVPFYLRTGKGMAEKMSEIVIQFRCPPHQMFSSDPLAGPPCNLLGICLQPDEGVHLRFEVKVPGHGMTLRPVDMEFNYESEFKGQGIPEAYETLIQNALDGDPSLFNRNDHVEEAWRIVDPLTHDWEVLDKPPLQTYEAGSWGPKAADDLLAEDGRQWTHGCGITAGARSIGLKY